MLFRKNGTASTILAFALLIALLASVNSLVNNINNQTTVLSKLAGLGGTYLVVNKDSTSLTDSEVNPRLAGLIADISNVKYALSEKIANATMSCPSGCYSVTVRV
jgi:ABC-type antimicrobial peptide transport system permease subunit